MEQTTRQKMQLAERLDVLISRIETNGNVRENFDARALKELTGNIKAVGILQPLILRRLGKDKFGLVAGERRLRAAKALKMGSVPAVIVNLTDREALQVQTYENLHRKDLTPVEEARAFAKMMGEGETAKALGEEVGKSETYVYRSIRLLELPEKGIKALEAGELHPSAALQILRVGPEKREELIKWATTKMPYMSRRPRLDEIRDKIERDIQRRLSEAWFPTDEPFAGKVACTKCPHNSGNQGMLFDGAQKGSCHNGKCYAEKTRAYEKDLKARGQKKYPALKFAGAARQPYSSDEAGIIGKGLVVTPALAKPKVVAKAVKDKPEAFGYGILKPRAGWGQKGKPKVVLVCSDLSALGIKTKKGKPGVDRGRQGAQAVDYEKQNRIHRIMDGKVCRWYWENLPAINQEVLLLELAERMLEESWGEARRVIEEKDGMKEPRKVLAYLLAGDDMQELARKAGMDTKKAWAEAQIEAETKGK